METAVTLDGISFTYETDEPAEERTPVFSGTSTKLPDGMVAVVGPNGTGKSTLLLLAGARLFPSTGTVNILGTDSTVFANAHQDPDVEQERNRLVSFVYQNMEFETAESVGDLMEFVHQNGFAANTAGDLVARIRHELEMDDFLHKRTGELAKGQMQRSVIAFSLLYGSRMVIMDEPVFAMEERQKDSTMHFLRELSRETGTSVIFSVHNLDLSRAYSDHAVLFTAPGCFEVGPTANLLTNEHVEAAYNAPMETLHRRDQLYRELLSS